jgi:hypothetical protein
MKLPDPICGLCLLLWAASVAGRATASTEPPPGGSNDPPLAPVPWVDGERLQLDVTLGNGIEPGAVEYRAMLADSNGRKVWRVGTRLFAHIHSLSWVEADAETFRPITSTWKHGLLGEAAATFTPSEVKITQPGKDPAKGELKQLVYDNEQLVHLIRRLPLAQGFKTMLPLVASLAGTSVKSVELEVIDKEVIEAPAGKFECFKVRLDIAQTYWISTDARRYLVKFDAGGAIGLLASVSQRHATDPVPFQDNSLGIRLSAPGNWVLFHPECEKGASNVIRMLDPQAEAEAISLRLVPTESIPVDSRTDLRKWAEADMRDRLGKPLKNFKVRADSWKSLTVSNRPALGVTADYGEKDKPKALAAVYLLGSTTSEQFVLTSSADKFPALKRSIDTIVETYQMVDL